MNLLTHQTLIDFNKYKPFYFNLLPFKFKLLIIFRWLVTKGKIPIDVWSRSNDGFSYTVTHPNLFINKVYTCSGTSGNWNKDFDDNLKRAIRIANILYNDSRIVNIPRVNF